MLAAVKDGAVLTTLLYRGGSRRGRKGKEKKRKENNNNNSVSDKTHGNVSIICSGRK